MRDTVRRNGAGQGALGRRGVRHALQVLFVFLAVVPLCWTASLQQKGGGVYYREGLELLGEGEYEEAAMLLWQAMLHYGSSPSAKASAGYTVEEAFRAFMQCYMIRGVPAEGYLFIAKEYIKRNPNPRGDMPPEAMGYLERALEVDPANAEAQNILATYEKKRRGGGSAAQASPPPDTPKSSARPAATERQAPPHTATDSIHEDPDAAGKTPEQLYEIGNNHFNQKSLADAAHYFELSCKKSGEALGPACANAVFCRTQILDWGPGGVRFEADMQRIDALLHLEKMTFTLYDHNVRGLTWQRTASVHPHMMLGYPLDPALQRVSSESYADTDEARSRIKENPNGKVHLIDLPPDLPYNQNNHRERFLAESRLPNFRIRVGIVSSAIKSTAVLYLTNQMFRFFDKTQFEIHVFATSPPDNIHFINAATSGDDWRALVRRHVDHFHHIEHLAEDHIALARLVHAKGMHIMIDWDGYARQGKRPQGLFALRPAPVQIFHQEFLGTSGGRYVDYLVSDVRVSPKHLHHLYTEKLLYMPNHFFSKSHAFMDKMSPPSYNYSPAQKPYVLGTGSPQENRCLADDDEQVSFVFCNFHKFLKFNPETLRAWLTILQSVPNSRLCLLENPAEGVPFLRKFIYDIDGYLNQRIHFLSWELNLFHHHTRNRDLCNVVLDTHPYNGHTTTMDALYAGVPVVTRSDLDHMAARVTTSANIVLGLQELNANGMRAYEDVAVRLASDASFYNRVRTKIIDSALQRNPRHPFWDVQRYVKDFQKGLQIAFQRYLYNAPHDHILVDDGDYGDSEQTEERWKSDGKEQVAPEIDYEQSDEREMEDLYDEL